MRMCSKENKKKPVEVHPNPQRCSSISDWVKYTLSSMKVKNEIRDLSERPRDAEIEVSLWFSGWVIENSIYGLGLTPKLI